MNDRHTAALWLNTHAKYESMIERETHTHAYESLSNKSLYILFMKKENKRIPSRLWNKFVWVRIIVDKSHMKYFIAFFRLKAIYFS